FHVVRDPLVAQLAGPILVRELAAFHVRSQVEERREGRGALVMGRDLPAGPPPRRFSQSPERSGLPLDVLGGGASRSGWPSTVLGTFGVGQSGHCADADAD